MHHGHVNFHLHQTSRPPRSVAPKVMLPTLLALLPPHFLLAKKLPRPVKHSILNCPNTTYNILDCPITTYSIVQTQHTQLVQTQHTQLINSKASNRSVQTLHTRLVQTQHTQLINSKASFPVFNIMRHSLIPQLLGLWYAAMLISMHTHKAALTITYIMRLAPNITYIMRHSLT